MLEHQLFVVVVVHTLSWCKLVKANPEKGFLLSLCGEHGVVDAFLLIRRFLVGWTVVLQAVSAMLDLLDVILHVHENFFDIPSLLADFTHFQGRREEAERERGLDGCGSPSWCCQWQAVRRRCRLSEVMPWL
jgi:hypothetical protein